VSLSGIFRAEVGAPVRVARSDHTGWRTTVNRIVYKPVGLALGAAAGLVAGVIFKQLWRVVTHDDDAPNATDEDRRWGEILAAAALQGAVFAIVKAAVDRGGAEGVRKLTGRWPT
jgi:hypothetical protein